MYAKGSLLAGCALAVLALAAPAYAQDTQTAAQDQENRVEDVVVTTEKRAESLQEVPVAISAYDDKTRDVAGILTIQDMAQFTPGFSFNTAADRPFIRGVGRQSNFFTLDSPVANYFDGVYTSSVQDASRRPMFIERTEIVRGPQGSLSGRGSIGGAVNIISKRPEKTFGGAVGVQAGNYGRYGAEATVTGPITDYLRGRVNVGVYRQNEGWFTDVADGHHEGDQPNNRQIFDFMLEGDVGPQVDFFLKAAFADYDETYRSNASLAPYQAGSNACTPSPYTGGGLTPTASYGYFGPGTGCGTTGSFNNQADVLGGVTTNPAIRDHRLFNSNYTSNQNLSDQHNYTGDVVWHAPWADVRYIGSHQQYTYDQHTDADGTAVNSYILPGTTRRIDPNGINQYYESRKWFSHELNLTSTAEGPFSWVFGLYQSFEQYNQMPQNIVYAGFPELNTPLNATTFAPVQLNPVAGRAQYGELLGSTRSTAGFGQIEYTPSKEWKFTAGLRYNKDEKKAHEQTRLIYNNAAFAAGAASPISLDLTPSLATGYAIVAPAVLPKGYQVVDISGFPTVTSPSGTRTVTLPNGAGTATLAPGQVIALAPGVVGLPYVDPVTGYRQRDMEDSWHALTGNLGVDYHINDDNMVYARYARGYRPGGFNGGGFISSVPETDKESVNSYEVGSKSTINGSFRLNAAAFYYDYRNIQLPLATFERCTTPGVLTTCTAVNSFVNIPTARNYGLELEGIWMPTNDFQMIFSYGYLNAAIKNGKTAAGFENGNDPAAIQPGAQPLLAVGANDPLTGLPRFTQDISGNPIAFAPEHKVAINGNYTFRDVMDYGDLTLSVSWIYTGKSNSDFFNNDANTTPSNTQTNLRAIFNDKGGKWQLIGYVQNVFDQEVVEFGNVARRGPPDGSLGQVYYHTYDLAPPRTFGIEVQRRF